MRKLVCFWLCLALVVPVWSQSGKTAAAAPDSAGQRGLPVMVIDQWQDMSSTNMQIEIMHPEEKPGFELWIIAVMLTLYGVFSLYYKGYLSENIRVVFNYRLATQIERERELANTLPGLVLMLLFFLSAGLLLWKVFPPASLFPSFGHPLLSLLAFLAVLPTLYALKRVSHFLFSKVFLFGTATERFIFLSNVLFQTAGYVLFPFLFLFYLSDDKQEYIFLPVAAGLLALLLVLRAISLLRVAVTIPQFRVSYFLLYFCAFEIAPIVIVLSILEGNAVIQL